MTPKKPPSKKKAKELIFPNRLREKVGGTPGKAGSFDPDLIAKAEKKVEEISLTYTETASEEIFDLQAAYTDCASASSEDQATLLRKINHLVHDIKGNGSSFGYPLLTEFAAFLFDMTDNLLTASPQQLEIIKAHIDAMQVVVNQKIKGDGGEIGRQLKLSLKKAVDKYARK